MRFQKGHKINLGKHNTLGKHWKMSEEGRKNVGIAHKGKKLSEEHKLNLKKNHKGMLGKHHSEETKKLLSIQRRGNNGSNWQGGKTKEIESLRHTIEFRLWRESVFARDNYTCQRCGIRGGKLHPHHIKRFRLYPELRFAIDNGITFCQECHKNFHKIYGYRTDISGQLL